MVSREDRERAPAAGAHQTGARKMAVRPRRGGGSLAPCRAGCWQRPCWPYRRPVVPSVEACLIGPWLVASGTCGIIASSSRRSPPNGYARRDLSCSARSTTILRHRAARGRSRDLRVRTGGPRLRASGHGETGGEEAERTTHAGLTSDQHEPNRRAGCSSLGVDRQEIKRNGRRRRSNILAERRRGSAVA